MRRLAGFFSAVVLLCGSALSPALAQDKTLIVFAAASMKNALDDIDTAFTANPASRSSQATQAARH